MNGKLVLVMVSLMLLFISLKADDNADFCVITGYGYYEALFAGVKYEGVNKSRWQLGAGYNFNINNISYNSAFVEYQKALIQFKDNYLETGIAGKLIFWRQSDKYLIWENLGVTPNAYFQYRINNKISSALSIGPQLNINLNSERKNYQKTGWITRFNFNFQITFAYVL